MHADTSLTSPELTSEDVTSLGTWRRNSAHDMKYMDTLSSKSLAAQVCDGSTALVQSSMQGDIYDVHRRLSMLRPLVCPVDLC
jgi:hypothetical protein